MHKLNYCHSLICILGSASIILVFLIMSGCSGENPGDISTISGTNLPQHTDTPITLTNTQFPTDNVSPIPTQTQTPTLFSQPSPTSSITPSPTQTPTPSLQPSPTPVPYVELSDSMYFVHPVGSEIPMYNFYDLNPAEGEVVSNAGKDLPIDTGRCNGLYFVPAQLDNHFAYDYGAGHCGANLVGQPVYGMSVGFQGAVQDILGETPKIMIHVDYGPIKCLDGIVRNVYINFNHSTPNVGIGDPVDSHTIVAYLDSVSQEIEIQVEARDLENNIPVGSVYFINPQLIGLNPRIP